MDEVRPLVTDDAFGGGTRFRLFAQPPFLSAFAEPETVWVSPPAGAVGSGPSDDRMYVIDPVHKPIAYGYAKGLFSAGDSMMPPWRGDLYPPAEPDEDGHFDQIDVDAPEFEAAHLYGVVRRTLDVWEGYFGHPLPWHFHRHLDRLELVLQRNLEENAFMGYGFLEVGHHRTAGNDVHPFSLNFDVIAHEVGHSIVFSVVGVPTRESASGEYYGFHESAADLTALMAVMHFDSVIDRLLENTSGNLYTLNLLNRVGELSDNEQIRLAANPLIMSDFVHGWSDDHLLAQPLTGAMFDVLVDVFHEELVARDLISERAEDISDQLEGSADYHARIQPVFDGAFGANPGGFKESLQVARDILGVYLAETWRRLDPHHLGYDDVRRALLRVDRDLTGGRYGRILRVNFDKRGIGRIRPGPRLKPPDPSSHAHTARTFVPKPARRRHPRSYRVLWELRKWRADS